MVVGDGRGQWESDPEEWPEVGEKGPRFCEMGCTTTWPVELLQLQLQLCACFGVVSCRCGCGMYSTSIQCIHGLSTWLVRQFFYDFPA